MGLHLKVVLALDLGTKTGWALREADGTVRHGNVNLRGRGTSRNEGYGQRFLRFERWLEGSLEGVSEVVYEKVRRHLGTDAAHVYGGLEATLSKLCEQRNIPYRGIPVGTIKKGWTGAGNASKLEMLREAERRGFSPATEDEADALAILHVGAEA